MKTLDRVALVILIIGGVNYLLVGLFEFNLVASIFWVRIISFLVSSMYSMV